MADDPNTFAAIQTSKVEPGQCAVWQIVAKNEGDALVKNVVVNDTIPAYTSFLAGSLLIDATAKSDSVGNDEAEIDLGTGKVTYYLGAGANAATPVGGDLQAGETSTVHFGVKVDQ